MAKLFQSLERGDKRKNVLNKVQKVRKVGFRIIRIKVLRESDLNSNFIVERIQLRYLYLEEMDFKLFFIDLLNVEKGVFNGLNWLYQFC